VLSGSECGATCLSSVITAAVDGDGCCPAGANANSDNDCTAMCGNGVLEAGELCDTGITAGAGACPTACNDNQACTTDALISGNSCQAHCTNTQITAAMNGDGCCPAGATTANDNDCSAACGNGVVDTGETCDTAILVGTGRCPVACTDGMACTRDVLANPGTCTAACTFPAITMVMNNDGCCPPGGNALTDNDCLPRCGNGVKEGLEQCDDGNMNNTDACTNTCMNGVVPTAFRFDTLALRDPHAFATVFLSCTDITDSAFGNAVNEQIAKQLTTDGNMDGKLDFSPTVVFRPLNQTANASTPMEIQFADCTAPIANTSCKPGMTAPIPLTATNQASQCLGILAGTVHPYTPPVTATSPPCFVSNQATVTVTLSGIPITLYDARIAATYVGTPANRVVNGLLRGFVTEADADATILPSNLAIVGGHALSYILPGGDPPGNDTNCRPANQSDKDINNGVSGWWFYLNFTAPQATWSDN
jgi:cysteine-rich repeat protein